MYIEQLQILNYKSFRQSPVLQLRKGLNVVAGPNNVGKTAFLEAVGLVMTQKPHRSISTNPRMARRIAETSSEIRLVLALEEDELEALLAEGAIHEFLLPASAAADPQKQEWAALVQAVRTHKGHRVRCKFVAAFNTAARLSPDSQFPSLKVYESWPGPEIHYGSFRVSSGEIGFPPGQLKLNMDAERELGLVLGGCFRQRLYRFEANRRPMGRCALANSPALAPDASNLPDMLIELQKTPGSWNAYNSLVRRVIPQIFRITVEVPRGANNQCEVLLWDDETTSSRSDLGIPLGEAGTGVSQLLAMLYVVSTTTFPTTIILDEPQNFLHPGALRALIEIFKEYCHHQYIIATHSSLVVNAADDGSIFCLRKSGSETKVLNISGRDARDLRLFVQDIGAQMSDIFGANRILWVEGPTEQEAFPLIVSELAGIKMAGSAIVGVRSTDEVVGKRAPVKLIMDIYRRLSGSDTLMPPAIGFVFDKEDRTVAELNQIAKDTRGAVTFLVRRSFENYLLDVDGIAAVYSAANLSAPRTAAEIQAAIDKMADDPKYRAASLYKTDPAQWIEQVDAARLLHDVFQELSGGTLEYRKTLHSVEIARWLIANRPDALADIAKLLREMLAER